MAFACVTREFVYSCTQLTCFARLQSLESGIRFVVYYLPPLATIHLSGDNRTAFGRFPKNLVGYVFVSIDMATNIFLYLESWK